MLWWTYKFGITSELYISFIDIDIVVSVEPEVINEEDDNAEAASSVNTELIRVCRHMGIADSSPSCDICKLVSFFFK